MQWSPWTLAQFENPYTAQVTGATQSLFNQQNAEQFNQANAAAASAGAFGGDREAVLEGQMAQQQQLAEDPTLAGIQSQGFTTAAGLLGQQQNLELQGMEGDAWRAANAAGMEAGLGNEAQASLLNGASSELQAGALQQQLQQEQLDVPEAQFQQQQAYPFQTTDFLAGLTEGVGGGMGGTGSTTSPGPSVLGQIAGLGMTGLGIYGMGAQQGWWGAGSGAGDISALAAADNPELGGIAAAGGLTNRGGRVPQGFPSIRRDVGGFVPSSGMPNFGVPGLPNVAGLSAGDMADVNKAVGLASASPVVMPPAGAHALPFSAPQAVQNTSGGDNTMQTIGTLAQLAGIAAIAFSDPALKETQGPARDALAALRGMQVDRARYKWDGPGTERPMLMADSVARAAPHAVAGAAPTRTIKPLELIPLLVQGVKELDRRTRRRAGGRLARGHHHRGFPRALADGGDAPPELGGDDGLDNFLIRAGAAMMASPSPFFLTQLGDGLQAGLAARPPAANAPHVDESGRFFRLIYPGARSFGSRLPNINGPYRGLH
jgi:hypothetical protein